MSVDVSISQRLLSRRVTACALVPCSMPRVRPGGRCSLSWLETPGTARFGNRGRCRSWRSARRRETERLKTAQSRSINRSYLGLDGWVLLQNAGTGHTPTVQWFCRPGSTMPGRRVQVNGERDVRDEHVRPHVDVGAHALLVGQWHDLKVNV